MFDQACLVQHGQFQAGNSDIVNGETVLGAGNGIAENPLSSLLENRHAVFLVGHCPADVIPLWDQLSTQGSELVVLYPQQDAYLLFSLDAYFRY